MTVKDNFQKPRVVIGGIRSDAAPSTDDGDQIALRVSSDGSVNITTASGSTVSVVGDAAHVESTLLDLTNIAANTTAYAYLDMDGYRYFTLQGETSDAAPTDVLTVTIEATVQDDGTAQDLCDYQDVTASLFGVASWVDTDFIAICDLPTPFKYVRVKYTTSNTGGDDADLTVYAKRMW